MRQTIGACYHENNYKGDPWEKKEKYNERAKEKQECAQPTEYKSHS